MVRNEASQEVGWRTCKARHSCIGVQIGASEHCLEHADGQARHTFISGLKPESSVDLRGTRITPKLLEQICQAVKAEDDRPTLGLALFDQAQFLDDISFSHSTFLQRASFGGARFLGSADFSYAQFAGDAQFSGVEFRQGAFFFRTNFQKVANFINAEFKGNANFLHGTFASSAWFDKAHFVQTAGFEYSEWESDDIWLWFAQFDNDLSFRAAVFKSIKKIGPLLVIGRLELSDAAFKQPVIIEAATPKLVCMGAVFEEGVNFSLRWAGIVLDGTVFNKPSVLSEAVPLSLLRTPKGIHSLFERIHSVRRGEEFDEGCLRQHAQSHTPRLLSLQSVDVSNLTLAQVDLAACIFAGARHLDELQVEGEQLFAQTPGGVRIGWTWPPVWRWTKRQTLAEEHIWRRTPGGDFVQNEVTHPKQVGWFEAHVKTPEWIIDESPNLPHAKLKPQRVALLYRALRKAREDSKNEPGAADFYYGEMEMRRLAKETSWGERVILTVYWLISGYGLRGMRAIASLGLVVTALAVFFHLIGFAQRPSPASFWGSLLYAVASTLSITADKVQLTGWGELLRIVLRVTGPVLLGLALLSVRNRVKR